MHSLMEFSHVLLARTSSRTLSQLWAVFSVLSSLERAKDEKNDERRKAKAEVRYLLY